MLISLLVSPAFACGGFFGPIGEAISSDAQQAILRPNIDSVRVDYRVRFTGNAQDFAWVIPVPGGVMSVEEGDEADFDELEGVSAPLVYDERERDDGDDEGCGCGATDAALSKSGGDTGAANGVVITGEGFAGDYSYVILAAEDGDSLQTWLADNGFDVSTAGSVIDTYVADPRGFEFVAVKVRQDVVNLDVDTVFSPLAITYGPGRDDALHADFPALMQSTSTTETNHVQLYVLADGRADVTGDWEVGQLGDNGEIRVEDDEDWTQMYDIELQDFAGDKKKLALVYAGEFYDGDQLRWVTRYDTIVQPAVETSDIGFTITDNVTYAETHLSIYDADGDDNRDGDERSVAAAFLLALGTAGSVRARRRRA